MIAATSEGWCFLIDGVSYLAVIVALLRMRIAPRGAAPRARRAARVQQFTRRASRYAFGFRPIRSIILLLALVSLVGVPYSVLMPVFAADGLPRRPAHARLPDGGVGLRRAARRAVARGAPLGRRPRPRDPDRQRAVRRRADRASRSRRVLWLALPCLVVAGFGFMVQMASSNTIIQTIVDDEKRGRVMSFYMMAFLGTAPFGSLIAGWLSSRIGAPHTLHRRRRLLHRRRRSGSPSVLPAIRAAVRPIYVRLGILPAVAAGLGNAAELSVPPERL